MKRTKLMSKLFSGAVSDEFKENVSDKVDEALENGNSTLDDYGEKLQFADVDGDVIVEDQANDNEVTRISKDPEDEDNLVVSAVDIDDSEIPDELPDQEEEVVDETPIDEDETDIEDEDEDGKDFSEPANPSIKINVLPGENSGSDTDLVDDLEVKIDNGINDEDKSGTKIESIHFKNFSKKRALRLVKLFSELASPIDEIVDDAKVDDDVQVKVDDKGKLKVMSVKVGKRGLRTFSDDTDDNDDDDNDKKPDTDDDSNKEDDSKGNEDDDAAKELADKVNDLDNKVENGITKDNVDDIKSEAEDILGKAQELEDKGIDTDAVKTQCKKFCDKCNCIIEKTESDTTDDDEITSEFNSIDSNGDGTVTKDEWVDAGYPEDDFIKADHNDSGFITIDDFRTFRSENKEFSQPDATLTISGLEPASVASLLKPKGVDDDETTDDKGDDKLEPQVDPNKDDQGKQFSITNKSKSINPLLFTEIK